MHISSTITAAQLADILPAACEPAAQSLRTDPDDYTVTYRDHINLGSEATPGGYTSADAAILTVTWTHRGIAGARTKSVTVIETSVASLGQDGSVWVQQHAVTGALDLSDATVLARLLADGRVIAQGRGWEL